MMNNSWKPATDDEFAIFLEDDTEVSPIYFDYVKWCLRMFFKDKARLDFLMGCSLYTPRLNEISPTPDPQNPPVWRPSDHIGSEASLFFFQLPCSWGAVYSGYHWKRFLQYMEKRKSLQDSGFLLVPESRSNLWRKSWKRLVNLSFKSRKLDVF
jgi:hypothetical protein